MDDYTLNVLDYKHRNKVELSTAFNVNEGLMLDELSDLTFNIPYYEYDGHGTIRLDDNGDKKVNTSLQFIQNENIIKLNNNYYLIKDWEKDRDNQNKKTVRVYCIEKAVELTYKHIPILDLSPATANPTRVDATIANLLSSKFNEDEGNIVASSGNTLTLSTSASSINDIYNGMYIAILDGSGQGQTFRIVDYNGSTKVATLDSTPQRTINATSIYRIYNFTWKVGNIDDVFLLDGTTDIKKYYLFENKTINECLNQIADRLNGFLTFEYVYDDTYGEFVNTVNLVKPNEYTGVEVRYKKNLVTSRKRSDSQSQIYTRIFLYGNDNLTIGGISNIQRTDSGVTYNEHTSGQQYIENFKYYLNLGYDLDFCRKNFINDKSITDELYVDANDLYDYGQEILEDESIPKLLYEISYVDLHRVSETKYEDFNIGDTIRVYDPEIGLNFYTTVIRKPIKWDELAESRLVLQNSFDDLGDYFNKVLDLIGNI